MAASGEFKRWLTRCAGWDAFYWMVGHHDNAQCVAWVKAHGGPSVSPQNVQYYRKPETEHDAWIDAWRDLPYPERPQKPASFDENLAYAALHSRARRIMRYRAVIRQWQAAHPDDALLFRAHPEAVEDWLTKYLQHGGELAIDLAAVLTAHPL